RVDDGERQGPVRPRRARQEQAPTRGDGCRAARQLGHLSRHGVRRHRRLYRRTVAAVTPSAPERLLSVAPSPAFWIAVVLYAAAGVALLVVLAGKVKARPIALALVAAAFVAHGVDIGWRGTQN